MRRYLVYGLIDPRTLLIRYVGKSSSGLNRPKQHKRDPSRGTTHCARWVSQLQSKGLQFEIAVLEETSKEELSNTERWWIAYGRASGWSLANHKDGDDGPSGYSPTPQTRLKMSLAGRGKPKSAEHRRNIGEGNTRRWSSQEARDAQSAKLTGVKRSDETKALIGAASAQRIHTATTRKRIGDAQRGRRRSAETSAKMTAVLTGRPVSDATRTKHRANALAQWAQRRAA